MGHVKPITEHPDVQRLIKEMVKLQAENVKLKDENAKLRNGAAVEPETVEE